MGTQGTLRNTLEDITVTTLRFIEMWKFKKIQKNINIMRKLNN